MERGPLGDPARLPARPWLPLPDIEHQRPVPPCEPPWNQAWARVRTAGGGRMRGGGRTSGAGFFRWAGITVDQLPGGGSWPAVVAGRRLLRRDEVGPGRLRACAGLVEGLDGEPVVTGPQCH